MSQLEPTLDGFDMPSSGSLTPTSNYQPPTVDHSLPIGLRAVAILLTHLGEGEEDGKNQGRVVIWACRRWVDDEFWDAHYSQGKMEWCAGSVSSALQEAGWTGRGSVHVGSLRTRLEHYRVDQPAPGDVVMLRHGGHVGFVERVDASKIYTIEGNAGNQVARRDYDLHDPQIKGYYRIS